MAASVTWFTCAGLAVTLALAAFTGVLARRAGLEQGTRAFENLARVTAATLAPSLDADPMQPPEPVGDMRTYVEALMAAGPVTAVRVRSATGEVLWADDASVVGQVLPLPAAARRSLQSGTVDSVVAEDEKGSGLMLAAYAGVRDVHRTQLLIEFHERYDEVTAIARSTWLRFAPAAIGALALLQVLQVPLAWRLACRLRHSQEAEDALLRAAVDASETERRRIAAEVHDHVVQDLTGLAYDLDAAQMRGSSRSEEDAALLAQTARAVRQTVEDLRSLLVTLMPTRVTTRSGLPSALRVLAQELRQSGVRVSVRTDGTADLPGPTAALLHRCAQEALRNVAAHSRATSVEVTVTQHEGIATMVIEDNGRGFDEDRLVERSAAGHVGLRALGELLVDARGSLTLASAPGEGTRLEATVPLATSPSVGALR